MYVRVSRLQFPVNKVDDAIRSFKETTLPEVKKIPGYAGVALQVNRETGQVGAATFWETKAAMEQAEEAGTRLRTQAASDSGGKVVDVLRFEQVQREMAQPPQAGSFARVTLGTTPKLDAVIEGMRTIAAPEVRKLRGFRAMTVGVDRATNRFSIVSTWDTAADREASMSTINELKKRIFEPNGVTGQEIINAEVALIELTAAAMAAAT